MMKLGFTYTCNIIFRKIISPQYKLGNQEKASQQCCYINGSLVSSVDSINSNYPAGLIMRYNYDPADNESFKLAQTDVMAFQMCCRNSSDNCKEFLKYRPLSSSAYYQPSKSCMSLTFHSFESKYTQPNL